MSGSEEEKKQKSWMLFRRKEACLPGVSVSRNPGFSWSLEALGLLEIYHSIGWIIF
jgi:hypothetical protein